jgi:hypothetical protein
VGRRVVAIDPATRLPGASLTLEQPVTALAVDPAGATLFVAAGRRWSWCRSPRCSR